MGRSLKGQGSQKTCQKNMSHGLVGKVVTISQLCRIKKGNPRADDAARGFFISEERR
jgi:hypothetical protein